MAPFLFFSTSYVLRRHADLQTLFPRASEHWRVWALQMRLSYVLIYWDKIQRGGVSVLMGWWNDPRPAVTSLLQHHHYVCALKHGENWHLAGRILSFAESHVSFLLFFFFRIGSTDLPWLKTRLIIKFCDLWTLQLCSFMARPAAVL